MGSYKKGVSLIACYKLDGTLVRTYESARKAALSIHVHVRTIDKAIREEKIIHNKIWRRFPIGEVLKTIEPLEKQVISRNPKPVGLLDENDIVIEVYSSLKEAAKRNGVDSHTVRDMLYGKTKTAKGKRYKFLNADEIQQFGIEISDLYGPIRVRKYSFDGELIKIYDSIAKAAKSVKVDHSAIASCLKGSIHTVAGYYWIKDDEHAEETLNLLMNRKKFYYSTIIQLDNEGKVIAKYKSTTEAENKTGIKGKTIAQAIRRGERIGGYYWKGEK